MIDRILGPLRTLLDMSPEKAVLEPESRRYPQLHLPLWWGREKDAPIRVLLLGGPLNKRRCAINDPTDPDIHIATRILRSEPFPHVEGVTYWYRMRRVPLEGFSLHRTAFYVGVVGEVTASFAPDNIVP